MNLGTNLFIAYLVYMGVTYISLFKKENRKEHKKKRKRLCELRNISVKTPEEQKEFIDLKYPIKPFFVWNIKNVLLFILRLGTMILVFFLVKWTWRTYIIYELALWQTLIIMILLPIILNKILSRFNLHQDDILVYFGGGRKI